MRFSVVTPSFRNSEWLKLCVASVADQEVEHEHIVQDSCSDDGTQDWLRNDPRVIAVIEKDKGMYDAINRGFRRARGEILSYINCDEQYLPGALEKVGRYFDSHPNVDILFGDVIVVDASGNYICDRKPITPQRLHTLVSGTLSFLTAALFIRRTALEKYQLYFDPSVRAVGDAEWTLRALKAGARMGVLHEFLSIFTETEANLGQSPAALKESRAFFASAPKWAQVAAPAIVAHSRVRRLLGGAYKLRPHQYAIYTRAHPDQRQVFRVEKPTFRWIR